jgi:S1-C subfamily serine protease
MVWALTARQIVQKVFPSVVLLVMVDAKDQPISYGSGFFVRDNIVATNLHVIEGAARGYAKIIGKKVAFNIAGTVGIDRDVDLVLLSIEGAREPILSLGNSARVRVGDEIYAVGNPQGLEGTFSKGMVNAIRPVGSVTIFQISAPLSPGSSGGPIVNTQGKGGDSKLSENTGCIGTSKSTLWSSLSLTVSSDPTTSQVMVAVLSNGSGSPTRTMYRN